jgi:hypothetical protein
MSKVDVGAASAGPASVEAEFASDSETANLLWHFGHRSFLPARTDGGKFKIIPQFWHWTVRGIT